MAFVYSCCFWFSLRLGGIIIGVFSLLQALLVMTVCSVAHNRSQEVKDELTNWINNMNLVYTKDYLEMLKEDPDKYFTLGIGLSCFYIITCVVFIYGAYTCNNFLMVGYILIELVRLIMLSIAIATFLLVLKQNTMDIGLLIGASVASGFFLLGMFYLWVCAASLPVLINEMEHDEQAALIAKLQQLIETNQKTYAHGNGGIPYDREVFMVPRNKRSNVVDKSFINGSKLSVPFYH